MTPLENLPEIEFVDSDKETVLAELVNLFTAITGRTLAQGDPIRLFLNTIAEVNKIRNAADIKFNGNKALIEIIGED